MTHAELCSIAARWLRLPESRGGPACVVAITEPRIGFLAGEVPDAIGFRIVEPTQGSFLIECKTSRADFRADGKKLHRSIDGMGTYRYYLAPEGLIEPSEVPPRWGLLVVTKRGSVKAVRGLAADVKNCKENQVPIVFSEKVGSLFQHGNWILWSELKERWAWPKHADREILLLTAVLSRVGDVDAANKRIRLADARYASLVKQYEKQRDELIRLRNIAPFHS